MFRIRRLTRRTASTGSLPPPLRSLAGVTGREWFVLVVALAAHPHKDARRRQLLAILSRMDDTLDAILEEGRRDDLVNLLRGMKHALDEAADSRRWTSEQPPKPTILDPATARAPMVRASDPAEARVLTTAVLGRSVPQRGVPS